MEQTNAGATGALIAQRRREKGWSQAELAEKLHVTDKAVSKWERGLSLNYGYFYNNQTHAYKTPC